MKIVLLLLFVVLAGAYAIKHLGAQPPLRGMAQDQTSGVQALVSRTRPPLVIVPNPTLSLGASGWRSLSPRTRRSIAGDARLWFALYQHGEGRLVTALAEAENNWVWEPAHHSPYPVLRELQYDYQGQTLYESLYQLPVREDPFGSGLPENEHVLVYRAKFLLFFRKMQVLVEYREPLPADKALDVRYDMPLLNAFQDRARKQWEVIFPGKEDMARLAPEVQKMATAPADFSRGSLSRWVGEMHWHDEL